MGITYRQNQQERLSVQQMDNNFQYLESKIVQHFTYIGLATQVDVEAPMFIELENTVGDITWSYGASGSYIGTLSTTFSHIFVPNNDIILVTPIGLSPSSIYTYEITKISEDTISLITMPFEGPGGATPFDNILNNTPIEIRFYK